MRSFEVNVTVNELSAFLVITANNGSGVSVPIDMRVPEVVFAQRLGTIMQAGMVNYVVYMR